MTAMVRQPAVVQSAPIEKETVKDKTRKLSLPYFHRLPSDLEQYTRGEFAEYVRKEIELLEK